MNWYNFIFSENKVDRLRRHLIFWLLWWVYFTVSFFHYEQTGLQEIQFERWNFPFLVKSLLLLSIHVAACYYFINFLLPRYFFKGKYLALAVQIIIVSFLILVSSQFIYETVMPVVYTSFHYKSVINQNIWWTSITSGLLSAPKVISAAAAIKLLKRWWLKQKEKEKLEKEKLITDLQLLKAQIRPEFLFSSLHDIYLFVRKKENNRASILLLKLADILSYILYECDNSLVPLEKEIKTAKSFLLLKKTTMGDRLEIDLAEKGETTGKMIAPLLLFSFLENSFSYIGNKRLEKNWINLEFQIEQNDLTMKLIHGKAAESQPGSENEVATANAVKRLKLFYAGRYELKTTIEPEMMMTSLKISLEESVEVNTNGMYTAEQIAYVSA
jgi:sensor histidine kinase YesM